MLFLIQIDGKIDKDDSNASSISIAFDSEDNPQLSNHFENYNTKYAVRRKFWKRGRLKLKDLSLTRITERKDVQLLDRRELGKTDFNDIYASKHITSAAYVNCSRNLF